MSAPKERPTSYRATWKFELRYPRDYEMIRSRLNHFTKEMEDLYSLQSDYLSIKKVKRNGR